MKLLIVTQTVDTDDPILGFFVRWIEEFAKHTECVEVICLKEGKHTLPTNVRVHSLGKERGATYRATYAARFLSLAWKLRHEYDAVFVHMNPEYVVLGGPFWRLWSKRIGLWYTHKSVDLKLHVAAWLVNVIFTASKESFRMPTKKLHVMGHGIDVDFFSPDAATKRQNVVLSAGRLSPTKRHDLIIHAAKYFSHDVWIAGDGPERAPLESLAETLSLGSRVHFLGSQTQEEMRRDYRTAGVLAHASETGSLDKVVLEALACGLPVITTSATLSGLPVTCVSATPDAITRAVIALPRTDTAALAAYVREQHSLQRLIPRVLAFMRQPSSDPRVFYDTIMPEKLGSNYERARWQANPLLSAQYRMMTDVLERLVLPNVRGVRRILEVGPGPGTWTKLLLETNPVAQYILVDISKEMLAQAREGLVDHANIAFVESDFLAFESSQPFDFFFSSRAIEYIPNKPAACAKIAELLAPGAHGVIITKMPKPLFDWLRNRSVSDLHGSQVSPRTLARMLGQAGLRVECIRLGTATVPLAKSAMLNRMAYRLFKYLSMFLPISLLAESYIVTFEKPL